MKVLVDTSVWSLVFRKSNNKLSKKELEVKKNLIELIEDGRVAMIGPIRQEILSGITSENTFASLRDHLKAFEDITVKTTDYEIAANFFNVCRKKGIQGSHIDFLICAIAHNHQLPIFTLDKDFLNYKKFIDIEIYKFV